MDTLAWRQSWSCQALAAREFLPPEALKGFFFLSCHIQRLKAVPLQSF